MGNFNQQLPRRNPEKLGNERKAALGTRLLVAIASIMIVGLLMRGGLQNMWLNNVGGWQDTEFDAAASRFQSYVMLAHVEWIRLGEPRQVSLEVSGDSFVEVPMGRSGWPVAKPGQEITELSNAEQQNEFCLQVWKTLGAAESLQKTLQAEYAVEGARGFCYFYYDGVLRFRYQPSNGQIYHEPKPA
ncbi:MAG: hypothetical protein LAT53_06345 [Idiomarina sp.]|nr:hypothetical protein [Idiomarina sp.]